MLAGSADSVSTATTSGRASLPRLSSPESISAAGAASLGWVTDNFGWLFSLLAVVTIDPSSATLSTRARPGHDEAAAVAATSVRRFAAAALNLTV